MKTKILIVALFVSMVFFSCKETQKAGVDNKLEFDTIRIEKTHYYMGDTAQTSATIAVSFVYPIVKDGDSVAAKVRDIIASLYFEDSLYVSLEPQKSTNLYVENFGKIFNQTLDSYKNQLDEFDGEDPFFTVSEILKGHVLYSKNAIHSGAVTLYLKRKDIILTIQYMSF